MRSSLPVRQRKHRDIKLIFGTAAGPVQPLCSTRLACARHPAPDWLAYGVAVLATAACLLIRWPLRPVLGDAVPHLTFFPAVMIAAYFGGFWPGLLATILSAVAANYFFTEQGRSFHVTRVDDVAALILFVLVGTIISGLCESLHRARRRLVAEERRRAEEALRETEERFRQLAENIHEIYWMMDARERSDDLHQSRLRRGLRADAPEPLRRTALLGRESFIPTTETG